MITKMTIMHTHCNNAIENTIDSFSDSSMNQFALSLIAEFNRQLNITIDDAIEDELKALSAIHNCAMHILWHDFSLITCRMISNMLYLEFKNEFLDFLQFHFANFDEMINAFDHECKE